MLPTHFSAPFAAAAIAAIPRLSITTAMTPFAIADASSMLSRTATPASRATAIDIAIRVAAILAVFASLLIVVILVSNKTNTKNPAINPIPALTSSKVSFPASLQTPIIIAIDTEIDNSNPLTFAILLFPLIVVNVTRRPTNNRNRATNAVAFVNSSGVNLAASLQTPTMRTMETEIESNRPLIFAICLSVPIVVNVTRIPTKSKKRDINSVAFSISSVVNFAAILTTTAIRPIATTIDVKEAEIAGKATADPPIDSSLNMPTKTSNPAATKAAVLRPFLASSQSISPRILTVVAKASIANPIVTRPVLKPESFTPSFPMYADAASILRIAVASAYKVTDRMKIIATAWYILSAFSSFKTRVRTTTEPTRSATASAIFFSPSAIVSKDLAFRTLAKLVSI